MALAFSFLIQNDFLYSIKTNESIKSMWPLKLKNIEFEKICTIQSSIGHTTDLDFSRLYSMFYHHMYNQHVIQNSKYRLFIQTLNNNFYEAHQKETFIQAFCKFQKIYFGFCKLAQLFKLKKIKTEISYDLCFNVIDENSKKTLTVILDNRKYLFSLTDVVNMFNNALTNMNFMITVPVPLKNPYTNNPFPISILYTMYFFLKNRLNMMPILIEGYFRCNFDLHKFLMLYDNYIQDISLENFVKTSPTSDLRDGLCSMLNERTMANDAIKVHPRFPEKELIEIMKPYLILYYKSKYSRTAEMINHNYILLKNKLHEFFIYNPNFGKLKQTLPNGQLVFNNKHIPPNNHKPPKIYVNNFDYNEQGLQNSSLGNFRNRRMGHSGNAWLDIDLDGTSDTESEQEQDSFRI